MTPAMTAAVDAGRRCGLDATEPVVVQETNNAVIWLRPHAVIAKVGMWRNSAAALLRELEVARALLAAGGAIAPPFPGSAAYRHEGTGFTVTLWQRLEHDPAAEPDEPTIGRSLGELHGLLAECDVRLPDFADLLRLPRRLLEDDRRVPALAAADVAFLRHVFDTLMPDLDGRTLQYRALHGEPHGGNRLATADGIRWIDFESTCRGPLEWDLAFQSARAGETFDGVEEGLLDLLSVLNSARVATWCWRQAHFPEMRWHGAHHLGLLRERWG